MVASFSNQIKSEYYGGNIFMYMEGIELDQLSPAEQLLLFSTSITWKGHAVFPSFLSDDSKQDSDTKSVHSKHTI